jgi:hypothetical protein
MFVKGGGGNIVFEQLYTPLNNFLRIWISIGKLICIRNTEYVYVSVMECGSGAVTISECGSVFVLNPDPGQYRY